MNSRLLIIDDDEKLNLLLTDYLGKMGFEVLSAVLPEEGLQMLEQKNPDLVILDVMPNNQAVKHCSCNYAYCTGRGNGSGGWT